MVDGCNDIISPKEKMKAIGSIMTELVTDPISFLSTILVTHPMTAFVLNDSYYLLQWCNFFGAYHQDLKRRELLPVLLIRFQAVVK